MGITAVGRNAVPDPMATAQAKTTKADSISKDARPAPPPPPRGTPKTITASSSTLGVRIYDKRDSNKDSKVSAQEIIQYAIKHPAPAAGNQSASQTVQKQSQANYDQQGKISDNTNLLKGNIDTSI